VPDLFGESRERVLSGPLSFILRKRREWVVAIISMIAILRTASVFAQTSTPTESPTPVAEASAPATPDVAPSASPSATATPIVGAENALEIEVVGLRNDAGQVGCSLFNDPVAYPRDGTKVLSHVWAPIHQNKAVCQFIGLKPGTYAAVVYHDENGDREFNMNAFGMPKEGYGFSNDAAALFGPPQFAAASFNYAGKKFYTVITIRY
jgi:uncharacterized protein (DUF2141 family)